MADKVAVVGAKLDPAHGGTITKGSTTTTWNGMPIARVGDEAVCSKHGKTKIIEGSAIYTVDGKPAALVGSKCACGAKIFTSDCLITADS